MLNAAAQNVRGRSRMRAGLKNGRSRTRAYLHRHARVIFCCCSLLSLRRTASQKARKHPGSGFAHAGGCADASARRPGASRSRSRRMVRVGHARVLRCASRFTMSCAHYLTCTTRGFSLHARPLHRQWRALRRGSRGTCAWNRATRER